ncbi:hypothetical protein GCM10009660_04610 [Catellatospora bangladeshensis]
MRLDPGEQGVPHGFHLLTERHVAGNHGYHRLLPATPETKVPGRTALAVARGRADDGPVRPGRAPVRGPGRARTAAVRADPVTAQRAGFQP